MLGKFDYFSTVSGGGYIGSFLTAWRHQAGNDDSVVEGLDRGRANDGAEAPQIAGLRADSNYLTPKLGMLSADTWTVVALVVRNLMLNWVVFLPFFMGVLLIPWLYKHALDMLTGGRGIPWLAVSLAAVCVGLGFASYGRRRSEGVWLTDLRFVLLVLCPIVVAAIGFSAAAAAFQLPDPGQMWLPLDRMPLAAVVGGGCYALAWLAASVFHPAAQAQRQGHPQSDWGAADFVSWIVAGLIAGVVLRQGIWFAAAQTDKSWLAALGISWTMLSIFAGEFVYVGLRSYSPRGDMDREWLARAAGWIGAWAATWLVIATTALVGPAALSRGWGYAIGAVGGVSGLVALVLGGGAWTAATNAAKVASRLSPTQIASIAGVLFALALAVLISKLDMAVGSLAADWVPAWLPKPVVEGIGVVVLIGFSALASRPINVNRFSLHAVYRNRLVRAFLGSARRAEPPVRKPDPFTNFDPADNPLSGEDAERSFAARGQRHAQRRLDRQPGVAGTQGGIVHADATARRQSTGRVPADREFGSQDGGHHTGHGDGDLRRRGQPEHGLQLVTITRLPADAVQCATGLVAGQSVRSGFPQRRPQIRSADDAARTCQPDHGDGALDLPVRRRPFRQSRTLRNGAPPLPVHRGQRGRLRPGCGAGRSRQRGAQGVHRFRRAHSLRLAGC